jgi:hypothetical protein
VKHIMIITAVYNTDTVDIGTQNPDICNKTHLNQLE